MMLYQELAAYVESTKNVNSTYTEEHRQLCRRHWFLLWDKGLWELLFASISCTIHFGDH